MVIFVHSNGNYKSHSKSASLAKRWWWNYDDNSNSGWYTWGRWVLLAVIIGVALFAFIVLQLSSCRRARHGQRPIAGTAWMVPPSYYAAAQQNQNDAVPLYKQTPGEGDAGHYDSSGNFVPLQQYPNQSQYPTSQGPPPPENQDYSQYPPPEGPPPPAATSASDSHYVPASYYPPSGKN